MGIVNSTKALVILVGLTGFLSACDEGVDGTWEGDRSLTIGSTMWLTLEESGDEVTGYGNYGDRAGSFALDVVGTVRGDKVDLNITFPEDRATFAGTFDGDRTMKGIWTRYRYGPDGTDGLSEDLTLTRDPED